MNIQHNISRKEENEKIPGQSCAQQTIKQLYEKIRAYLDTSDQYIE